MLKVPLVRIKERILGERTLRMNVIIQFDISFREYTLQVINVRTELDILDLFFGERELWVTRGECSFQSLRLGKFVQI